MKNLILIFVMTLLTACGATHYEYRETFSGKEAKWESKDGDLHLGSPQFENGVISIPVMQNVIEEEMEFSRYSQESRRVKDPNLFNIILSPITLFALCLDGDCFGKTGYWSTDRTDAREPHPTGRTRASTPKSFGDIVKVDVSVIARASDGSVMGEPVTMWGEGKNGKFVFPLESNLARIAKRPETLDVVATLRGGYAPDNTQTITISSKQLQKLQLDHWMDQQILVDMLMEKIINAFMAKKPAEALPYFDRLIKTGIPLPERFYFYQLEALEAGGRKTEAREQAEAFLKKYGKNGKHYTNVISLLARL